jgi:hypothetical protein
MCRPIQFVVDMGAECHIFAGMEGTPSTHRQIIETFWPSVADYAKAIDVRVLTAKGHRDRSSIPSAYWQRIVEDAREKGYSLTADMLAKTQRRRAAASRYEAKKVE